MIRESMRKRAQHPLRQVESMRGIETLDMGHWSCAA